MYGTGMNDDMPFRPQGTSPRLSKAAPSGSGSGHVRGSPVATAAVTGSGPFAPPFNYEGMAQGPFLMNTPRNAGPSQGGLSVTAPSWYSPPRWHQSPSFHAQSLSRGPRTGFPIAHTDDDSFFDDPNNSLDITAQRELRPSLRARASTLSVVSPLAATPSAAADSFSIAAHPMSAALPSSCYGAASLSHHRRSLTANSMGSTATSLGKCHLSRKDDHLDPVNMTVVSSRELRMHSRGGLYSTSTVGTTNTSFRDSTNLSGVGTNATRSNSFYQPLYEQPPSPSCSLGSLGVDAFDVPSSYADCRGDSRYTVHSGRGAAGCSASLSITYNGSPSRSSLVGSVMRLPVTADNDAVRHEDRVQGESASSESDDDEAQRGSASPSQATYSFGTVEHVDRSASYSTLSPLETGAGVAEALSSFLTVAPPPCGERRSTFVRRHYASPAAVKAAALPTMTADEARLDRSPPAASSCPARVFEGLLAHRLDHAEGIPSPRTNTGPNQPAAYSSPETARRVSGAGTGEDEGATGWVGIPPPVFRTLNTFNAAKRRAQTDRFERSASF